MSISVYDIHAAIHLKNMVSPALLKVIGEADQLNKSFEKLGNTGKAAFAAIGIAAGATVLVAMGKLAEKGSELLNQQEQLRRKGVELAEVNRLTTKSFGELAKSVPTAQASESLRVFGELRGALGSDAQAERLLPAAMKMQALLQNAAGGRRGPGQDHAFWGLLRSAEMKGIVTDPAKVDKFLDVVSPYFFAQGGKLTPAMFQAFSRGAGASWMNTDIDKATPGMMTAIGDLGGPMAGKAQATLYQYMMGSLQIPGMSADMLVKIGMMDPKGIRPGSFGKVKPGDMLGAAEHYNDIPGWVRDVLWPAIAKEAGGDPMKEQQIATKIFGANRNALRMAEMYGLPGFQEQIEKEKNIAGKVMPRDLGYAQFIGQNPKGVQEAFKSQWESMLSAIGAPLMQAAMPVMKTLTTLFTSIGSLANANPQIIGDLGRMFAMLATTSIGAGAGALVGILFGPPGAAVGGLVGAMIGSLAGFAAVKWDEITTGFNLIKDAITGFAKWLHDIGQAVSDWVTTLGGLLRKQSFSGGGFGGGGLINASYGGQAGGGAYNVSRAYDLIKAQGGTDEEARMLAAIAQPESRGNPLAHNANFRTGDNSYGLWQINMLGAMGPQRRAQYGLKSNEDLYDPATNARVALAMHRKSGGYGDWSTYRKGDFRKYLKPYSGGRGQQEVHIHNPVYLDGKMVADNTVTHILKSSEHSRGSAYFDDYHSFAGADRQVATA